MGEQSATPVVTVGHPHEYVYGLDLPQGKVKDIPEVRQGGSEHRGKGSWSCSSP